jgi:adenylate cyclase
VSGAEPVPETPPILLDKRTGDPRPRPPAVPVKDRVHRFVERLAFLGVESSDTDEVRTQKVTLTLAAVTVTVLAIVWVGTYLALGLPESAAIPLAYQVASVASLAVFARTKGFRLFRASQLLLIILLPFLLQLSLGGYVASSAVILWALEGALGAVFFYRAREAVPWFIAFLALIVLAGLLEPIVSQHPAPIPVPVQTAFFILNIAGVTVTAYLLLQYSVRSRDAALASSERLLLNVLPASIAERLKRHEGRIAEAHADVTVLFADVVDFTPFAEHTQPDRVVAVLDEVFSAFDDLARRHGVEKIKTIGDAYMVVAGLPEPRADHAEAMADMALDMQADLGRLCESLEFDLAIRIGMASGPVIAGVIGRHKFIYDLWGDTVNTASRMESNGLPGRIQVTEGTYHRLRDRYGFEERGEIEVKGKGRLRAYLLEGRLPASGDGVATVAG